MSAITDFLAGKKTYIIALGVGLAAAAQYLGYPIPEWGFTILGGLGLGAVRAAIKKGEI